MTQCLTNPTRIHEDLGLIPGLTQRVGESHIAVAAAWIPSLGTSICSGCSPRKTKCKKKKRKKKNPWSSRHGSAVNESDQEP